MNYLHKLICLLTILLISGCSVGGDDLQGRMATIEDTESTFDNRGKDTEVISDYSLEDYMESNINFEAYCPDKEILLFSQLKNEQFGELSSFSELHSLVSNSLKAYGGDACPYSLFLSSPNEYGVQQLKTECSADELNITDTKFGDIGISCNKDLGGGRSLYLELSETFEKEGYVPGIKAYSIITEADGYTSTTFQSTHFTIHMTSD